MYTPSATRFAKRRGDIFQHYESVEPAAPPLGNYNRRFSFYIVTHSGGASDPNGLFDPALRTGNWPTAELDETGQPRFPDGDCVVTVRASDFRGNAAERSETVRVAN